MNPSRPQIFSSATFIIILLAAVTVPFFFVGFEFSATKTALLSALAVLGACTQVFSLDPRAEKTVMPAAFLPLFLFLALAGLSAFWAGNRAAAGMELAGLAPGLVFFFLAYFSFPPQGFRKLALALALPVAGISLIGILQYLEILPIGMDRYGSKDPASTLGLSNFAAEYLAAVLPLLAAAGAIRGRIFSRIITGISFGLGVSYLLLTGNRAGWVGFLAGLLLLIVFPRVPAFGRKEKPVQSGARPGLRSFLVPGLITGLVLVVILLTPAGRKIPARFASIINLRDPAIHFRVLVMEEALRMSQDHPVLGAGPGNFSILEPRYQTPEMESLYQGLNVDITRVHNEYLGTLAELGIPAALLALIFLGYLLAALLRSFPESRDQEEFLSRLGILGGLAASLVTALFAFNLHNPSSGFIFWLLAGAALKTGSAKTLRFLWAGRGKTLAVAWAVLGSLGILLLGYIAFQNLRFARAEIYFRDGLRRMAMEKARPAEEYLSRAISLNPGRAGYFYNRAMCRHFLKNIPDAAGDMQRYLDLNPYSARGRQALGLMLVELGREPEAAREIERAIGLFPRPAPELFSLLLNLKLGAQEYDSVIRTGAEALKLHPNSPEILLAVSQARFYRGELEKAAAGYRRALEADPENLPARRYLGQTYIEMNKYEAAREFLLPAASQSPGSPELWYHLARAQSGAGETAAARSSLKMAIGLDPRLRDLALRDPLLSALR